MDSNGYSIVEYIFSENEVEQIISKIDNTNTYKPNFRKLSDLFAIRQFLKEIPEITDLIMNDNLKDLIRQLFGSDYFIVKSIYFDKPEQSNWFVSYHQDLTISVDQKVDLNNFSSWTYKQGQFGVQPPIPILENIFTIRIHLDDTDEYNGALKVIAGSHKNGIIRHDDMELNTGNETVCNLNRGGIMIMRPLLFHSSQRTTNHKKRRVIHLEFSNMELPEPLKWAEKFSWE